MKRLLFALFLSLVACGISFYLILFGSLAFMLFVRGVNPARAPELADGLRHVALPVSGSLAVMAFVIGMRRKDRASKRRNDQSQAHSHPAAGTK